MALRGERFDIDLSDDEGQPQRQPPRDPLSFSFVSDIKERRPTSEAKPPTLPKPSNSKSGFPEHKKRTRLSAFKQGRGASQPQDRPSAAANANAARRTGEAAQNGTANMNFYEKERQEIDEENKRRLAEMTPAEIEQERRELLSALSPSMLERLLRRANIDDGKDGTGIDIPEASTEKEQPNEASNSTKTSEPEPAPPEQPPHRKPDLDAAEPTIQPTDLYPASSPPSSIQPPDMPRIHFPNPPQPSPLDPSDPSFLNALHETYYPTLAADPSKLAWMSPLNDENPEYSTRQQSFAPSQVRFDFRARLLPPRLAREIPVTAGLHHHGDAPEAAGYTVPELAHLARSSFPAQRCIAYQTLGRILYRLGGGGYGGEGSPLVMGLWKCMDEGRVIEGLEMAARERGGERHLSARTFAVEALWNWRRGGGRRWKAQ